MFDGIYHTSELTCQVCHIMHTNVKLKELLTIWEASQGLSHKAIIFFVYWCQKYLKSILVSVSHKYSHPHFHLFIDFLHAVLHQSHLLHSILIYLIFNSLVTKDFSSNYTTFEFLCNKVKYFQFRFKILCNCL